MTFGEFVKEKRMATGLTLRTFCLKHNLDSRKLSKIEMGVSACGTGDEVHQKLMGVLRLGEADQSTYWMLAINKKTEVRNYLSGGRQPSDEEVIKHLSLLHAPKNPTLFFQSVKKELMPEIYETLEVKDQNQ